MAASAVSTGDRERTHYSKGDHADLRHRDQWSLCDGT
jgi:hypothetical protein